MLEPDKTTFMLLSFEGPDVYSQAGGLGVRVKELSRALAERGFTTHLFFVGDPNLPADESVLDGRLWLHRWSQWISRYHPVGVYDGENDKVSDINRSLPETLLDDYIRPAVERGQTVVILGEEWHLAHVMTLISDALYFAGLRDRCLLLWNANNHFSFHRINWGQLAFTTTLLTVSRYMKHIMWQWGVNPIVVPNGIPSSMMARVSQAQVRAVRGAANVPALLFKIGRFSPDKRWHQAIAAVAQLKERGVGTRLIMRGGLEPFGGEVLGLAAQLDLKVVPLDRRIDDVPSLVRTLKDNPDADIWNLTAFLPDDLLPVLYASATATLANSGHEPFGLVGLEAMASGGVAFVGATGEEYAQPFKNSIVIETDDAAEIVAYVSNLAEHPENARNLRIAAQRTAHDYTWQRVIDILLQRLEFVALKQGLRLPEPRVSA
ncbi:MAG TPA: glycosyltransferase [Candidatus Dormibacteraeota bacterium]|jgi:glycosyltransferase involved in cell wall biosynthesis|nr:glycosyltransferase [Candidatus Dormibacteraeota bacterium]